MWVCFLLSVGVSLFGIVNQVPFAKEMGFDPLIVASSMGVLWVVDGVGRGFVDWVSDSIGRRQTLTIVLAVEGVAQFGLLGSGFARLEWLFLMFALVSGFGTGAFYPLFAALTQDYFGENNAAQNYGLVYSARIVSGLSTGLADLVIDHWGYEGAYLVAGFTAILATALTLRLRQPVIWNLIVAQEYDNEEIGGVA